MRTKWAAFLIFCAYVMALAALTAPARAEPDEVTLPAVMYHHIDADAASSGAYVITPETFESDLRWLRVYGYESVSVRELLDWEAGTGSLPEKPVLLTFDDGQESFHAWALPLLEKYGMCAVAAVVGSYADEYTANGDTNVKYACMSWDTIAEAAATGRVEIASHTQAMHEADGERRGCRINPGENPADYAAALNGGVDNLGDGEGAGGLRLSVRLYLRRGRGRAHGAGICRRLHMRREAEHAHARSGRADAHRSLQPRLGSGQRSVLRLHGLGLKTKIPRRRAPSGD